MSLIHLHGSYNYRAIKNDIPQSSLKLVILVDSCSKSEELILKLIDVNGKNCAFCLDITYRAIPSAKDNTLPPKASNVGLQLYPNLPKVNANSNVSIQDIFLNCNAFNCEFVDPDFPPTDQSLYGNTDNGVQTHQLIVWKRSSMFMDKHKAVKVFRDKIEPGDIKQGRLGDCWILSALASIAEFPELVEKLFITKEWTSQGAYQLKLCNQGLWTDIILDDSFPCHPDSGGGPIYSRANGNELWVLLLEKAFAKMHGSYEALIGGQPYEAMINLTGAPYKEIRLKEESTKKYIQSGELFNYLCDCDKNGYIMSLSTDTREVTEKSPHSGRSTGLVPTHAYTLISVVQTSQGYQLLKIRNPWGRGEWTGDWSDTSPLWTPALKRELHFQPGDDGTFWMCFYDVVRFFDMINICKSRHAHRTPWKEERHSFTYTFGKKCGEGVIDCPIFILTCPRSDTELYLSVHQQDMHSKDAEPYIDIGIALLKATTDPSKYEHLASSGNSTGRQNQCHIKHLTAGEYVIIPTSSGAKMEQYKQEAAMNGKNIILQRTCTLVIHSTHTITFQRKTYDPLAYEEAMELPIIYGKHTEIQQLFTDNSATAYYRESNYEGASVVVKNNRTNKGLQVKLEFGSSSSSNLVSSRGHLDVLTYIPPGEAKVVHHLMRKDLYQSWNWRFTYNAKWLDIDEMRVKMAQEPSTQYQSSKKSSFLNGLIWRNFRS